MSEQAKSQAEVITDAVALIKELAIVDESQEREKRTGDYILRIPVNPMLPFNRIQVNVEESPGFTERDPSTTNHSISLYLDDYSILRVWVDEASATEEGNITFDINGHSWDSEIGMMMGQAVLEHIQAAQRRGELIWHGAMPELIKDSPSAQMRTLMTETFERLGLSKTTFFHLKTNNPIIPILELGRDYGNLYLAFDSNPREIPLQGYFDIQARQFVRIHLNFDEGFTWSEERTPRLDVVENDGSEVGQIDLENFDRDDFVPGVDIPPEQQQRLQLIAELLTKATPDDIIIDSIRVNLSERLEYCETIEDVYEKLKELGDE